ncbi:site-specific DNA-methyltransferase [Thioalkalivibrio sp. ALgr1]|uniref:site-specific DNA-methyltransferase n=1 Tax=Thioalkalivibrio sp. ALgr1 TaxID=748655 RepID=UPI0003A8DC51|nr:site-specific DNA-methyltransferase [Thioalkalivibrio sp. ALgr1]
MTELNFKGKEFVWNHHLTVPFRPLELHPEKGIGEPALDDNLVIHGDNLHALKALLPTYAGKVDCVYIDPPYNTGKSDWSYNDRVNSPMIREWLAANPITIEDQLRHDKWAAMMWPRLRLLAELMRPGATIFVSIDDNEVASLKLLMTEIFGSDSHLGTIIWKNATDNNPTNIAIEHEYIHVFAAGREKVEPVWKSPWADLKERLLAVEKELLASGDKPDEIVEKYKEWFKAHKDQLGPLQEYNKIDEQGIFTASRSVHNPGREGYRWNLRNPKTGQLVPQPLMGYRFPEETRDELLDQGRIIFSEDPNQLIRIKLYLRDYREKMPSVIEIDGRRGANELRKIFPDRRQAFKNPKTFSLIEWLISFSTNEESIILDSFAGSGTTAHAVLAANSRDNGRRKFILVECEDYADELTAERVRRVSAGVEKAQDAATREGLGGTFTYCTLGPPIELDKMLTGETLPEWEALGAVLFHAATLKPFDPATSNADAGYLGKGHERHVWLFYQPDRDWLRSPEAALTLSRARDIHETDPETRHLVFAPARHVAQKMLDERDLNVEFAPLPFALYGLEGG